MLSERNSCMAASRVLRQMLVVGLKIQIEKTFGKCEACQETTSTLASETPRETDWLNRFREF